MADAATLASLQKTVNDLSVQVAEIKATEADSQAELNTFYLMWAGAYPHLSTHKDKYQLGKTVPRLAQVR